MLWYTYVIVVFRLRVMSLRPIEATQQVPVSKGRGKGGSYKREREEEDKQEEEKKRGGGGRGRIAVRNMPTLKI